MLVLLVMIVLQFEGISMTGIHIYIEKESMQHIKWIHLSILPLAYVTINKC